MEAKQAWNTAVDQLQREMPKASFDTWVKEAEFLTAEDQTFQIGVQNAYARDWLASRMQITVEKILTGILNQAVEVQFQVVTSQSFEPAEDQFPPVQLNSVPSTPSSINHRYTFDNFVVGSSNRLAHAASLSVAEKPAQTYNPLFLYSGVGLGKTHLLYAIGNRCLKQNLQVLYVSSEEFTNDLITSIRGHTTQAFRDKYRQVDILLIDDIQFIVGKESTQEEFFHTFNTLHGQNKQIVLTSDCRPKAMVTLEERLRSRFEWGLTADIQAPDFETRIAILQAQADRSGYQIPQHILETIAHRFPSSIRELEGALTKLVAFAQLQGLEFTQDLV